MLVSSQFKDIIKQIAHLKDSIIKFPDNLDLQEELRLYQELYDMQIEYDQKQKNKVLGFPAICVHHQDCSNISPSENSNDGFYSMNKTAYIATKDIATLYVISCIMHEASHYIVNTLYFNKSLPFIKDDIQKSREFENKFQQELLHGRVNMSETSKQLELFININDYPKEQRSPEIVVRIVETMVLMGPEKGH